MSYPWKINSAKANNEVALTAMISGIPTHSIHTIPNSLRKVFILVFLLEFAKDGFHDRRGTHTVDSISDAIPNKVGNAVNRINGHVSASKNNSKGNGVFANDGGNPNFTVEMQRQLKHWHAKDKMLFRADIMRDMIGDSLFDDFTAKLGGDTIKAVVQNMLDEPDLVSRNRVKDFSGFCWRMSFLQLAEKEGCGIHTGEN